MEDFEFKNKLIEYYSFSNDELVSLFTPIKDLKLIDYKDIPILEKFKERIFLAISRNEKICIYGDYDADGILATSILMKTFEMLGYSNVIFYIPSRFKDGYGLTLENVIKMKKVGVSLIITVDNGISCVEAIIEANKLDIDVLVTDHHEPSQLEEVSAYAIFHSLITLTKDNKPLSKYNISGAYVALILSASLLDKYDPYLVSLASVTIISDMMIARKENRTLLRLGLHYLNKYRYPSLVMLCSGFPNHITERHFGNDIAPKINALGRIKEGKELQFIVNYFIKEDKTYLMNALEVIERVNEERKELTSEAILKIEENFIVNEEILIVLSSICEGLIGLVANRLMYEHNKPVVVFTIDSNDPSLIKGSMRSKDSFIVTEFLSSIDDILIKYGGHKNAGGLTLKKDNLDEFKSRAMDYAKTHPFLEKEDKTIKISLSDISLEKYYILLEFAPFGEGYEEPLFAIDEIKTYSLRYIKDNRHIFTRLSLNSALIMWNVDKPKLDQYKSISVNGRYELSEFRNESQLRFVIKKVIN